MGWWKAHPEYATLAELTPGLPTWTDNAHPVWGDGPADIMDTAIDGIREEFRLHMGREPMVSELLAGVRFYTNILDGLTPDGSTDVALDDTMIDAFGNRKGVDDDPIGEIRLY